jgi:hypothetical protein
MMPQPPPNDDVGSTLLDLTDQIARPAEQIASICKTPLLPAVPRRMIIKARDGISHAAYDLRESAELLTKQLTPWYYKKKEHGLWVFLGEAKRVVLFFIPTTLLYMSGVLYRGKIGSNFMNSFWDPLTNISWGLGFFAVLSLIVLLYRMLHGRIGLTDGILRSPSWSFPSYLQSPRSYFLLQWPLAFIPFGVMMLDKAASWSLLDPACATGSISDYFLLTLDSLAKGALIDFFESFHINLYACGAHKGSCIPMPLVQPKL